MITPVRFVLLPTCTCGAGCTTETLWLHSLWPAGPCLPAGWAEMETRLGTAKFVGTDACGICRNKLTHPSVEVACSGSNDANGWVRTFGVCGHVFHMDCQLRNARKRRDGEAASCALCDAEWECEATEQIDPSEFVELGRSQEAEASAVLQGGADTGDTCGICMERTSTATAAACRTAFLRCGHCFCQSCLIVALQAQPRCPTCRVDTSMNEIRVPTSTEVIEDDAMFTVKLKTLTGAVMPVRCTKASTVEDLKRHFAKTGRNLGIQQIRLIWASTELINGNTLAAYGLHEASASRHGCTAAAREISVVLRTLDYPNAAAIEGLAATPSGPVTVKVKTLLSASPEVFEGLVASTTFGELADLVATRIGKSTDKIRFIYAGMTNFPAEVTLADVRLGAPANNVCHLVLKL